MQAGELRIAFECQGDGPPLLLMHGAEASRQMFAELVPHLSKHFTVIGYDQRDCGETEGPEHASTLADLADDARQFIAALGLTRAHVFGSSFGGRVAQALALLHPGVVDHLVLGSTWPLPERETSMLLATSCCVIPSSRARVWSTVTWSLGTFTT